MGLKPKMSEFFLYRHINVTVKNITRIKQYAYSKHYSLPSALAFD